MLAMLSRSICFAPGTGQLEVGTWLVNQKYVSTMPSTRSTYFAPRAGQSEVGVDIVVAELLGDVETETSIFVVNFPLFLVTQRGICVIYFSELECKESTY